MVDFYLDPETKDLELVNGEFRLTQSLEEDARQQIDIVLSTFKSEWFYDLEFGVPYLDNEVDHVQLLSKVPKSVIDGELRSAIKSVELVVRIVSFTSSLENSTGEYTATTEVEVESGEILQIII